VEAFQQSAGVPVVPDDLVAVAVTPPSPPVVNVEMGKAQAAHAFLDHHVEDIR